MTDQQWSDRYSRLMSKDSRFRLRFMRWCLHLMKSQQPEHSYE